MTGLRPLKASYWDRKLARHLLNRAGFGVPQARVEALYEMGLEGAVSHLVHFERLGRRFQAPNFLLPPYTDADQASRAMMTTVERTLARQERQRQERAAIEQLKGWWLERMWSTPRPLEEKLTLFWHGHFATSSQKVRSSHHTYDLNAIFREHAAGNVKALTVAVGQSPSMLEYLDNRKSTKEHPNENWARELMELFTMGPGAYTEDDIKASARAFTGWSSTNRGFAYRVDSHDFGEKTFLGRTGTFDGWEVIDIIFEQEATAEFLCMKLWKFFVSEEVDARSVRRLAATLRANDYELKPVLSELFMSAVFYDPGVRTRQVKSPVQYSLQLCHDLGLEHPPFVELSRACRALGQDLFYPPNVKGWDGNRAWINANSLLIRYNLPPTAVQAAIRHVKSGAAHEVEAEGEHGGRMMQSAAAGKKRAINAFARQERNRVEAEMKQRLETLPREERRALQQRLRDAESSERMEILSAMGVELPAWEAIDPVQLFQSLKFKTAGECVDALAARFLNAGLNARQRQIFLGALGLREPDALTAAELSVDQRRALLRLVTSMAEYQLC